MQQRSFYFSEAQYLQILQSLCHDLTKSEAFVQLMGSAKSGKSSLCETLTLFLRRKGHDVIYIDYPIESPEMLRSVLAQRFNLPSTNNVARQLEDTFSTDFEKPKLLIFDDAHQLSDITLLEIHRMAEIQVGSSRALNVLLCGEPELDARLLNKKELASLLLNVSRKYLLKPMDKETLSQFFFSYIARTDSAGLQLAQDALDLLYSSSKGYPGPATLLVELIVQSNSGNTGMKVLSKLELAELINNSNIQQGLPSAELFNISQLKVLGPMAAVFTIAAMGFMFSMISEPDSDVAANQVSLVSEDNDSPFSTSPITPSSSPAVISQIETADDGASGSGSVVVALASELSNKPASAQSNEQTSIGAASNPALEPVSVQSIPSLLRPASVFSLDDEEYEEPVSDSGLALVTAAEIGLAVGAIAGPELENFDNAANGASNSSAENVEQQPLLALTESAESDLSPDRVSLTNTPNLDGDDASESSPVVIDEAVIVAASEGQLGEQVQEQLEEQVEQESEQLIPAENLISDTALDTALETTQEATQEIMIAEVAVTAVPQNIDIVDLNTETLSPVETQLDQFVSASVRARALVDSWVSAWEQQKLEDYFASYSSEFEPRYESSVARWKRSRTRVIGNAQSIRLTLSDFEIIEESLDSIEVHFWLDYESPTYSDSTKKKLVLGNDSGDWMILEEINLEVRS